MEIVTAIVTPVVESLMVPIKKQLGYLISCTKYVTDMGNKMDQLKAKRRDVESHMKRNKSNNLEVPTEVDSWLEKVGKIDEKVASIPSTDIGSCFNIKRRHKLGRKAFKIIEEINPLIEQNNMIKWTNHPIPLGKVDSKKASTSTPSSHHNDFQSRERTFMEALKQLQSDHKPQMIALCGMGGVGKTTMMEKLKKVVEENKLFNLIVKVVVGEKTNTIAIQDAVADYLGISLTEKSESARSDRLRKSFEAQIEGGKKKILVILDDVWQLVHLNDIGLSPLPNQGVGFKFLLTSRDQSVCTMIGVEANSIFKVDVIEELEAQGFFQRFVELSNDDHELHKIGEDIVRKCSGLPIAIRTIAVTLKDKSKDAWRDALSRLEHHDIHQVVHEVFEMSYKNLQDKEIQSIFLLCGLFLEDFDIPIEDLLSYGWGLELFKIVSSIAHARNRLNACIERLIHANLLIRSQKIGCVKMHDLVRDFVLDVCSKGEHASIIGNMSNWPNKLMRESCKRISLSCTGSSEFPRNFKFPNLSLLKLMHGDESLKFPEDFYEGMEKLQVIAYDKMKYPLLSRSLQCCTNLRTLRLSQCSLMFDCSSIGHLSNLEVLSFAHCRVRKLPSTIGNLKELKLLDLTGCVDLIIDDGVLKNLIKLEELYVKVGTMMRRFLRFRDDKKAIRFSDSICNELSGLSKNLFALEIEFFINNTLPKNMSFKKLERFKISLGCYLNGDDDDDDDDGQNRYENTLMLVTNKCELLDSRMNELFEKTEVLHFHVNDVNDLGDCLVKSLHHQQSSFYNLRVLKICKCENLRYLFTVGVANGLTKLERLTISSCPVLETLLGGERGELVVIKLQVLKFLSLGKLPKLMSLCNVVNVIELPQLEELILDSLPNFTSIYPEATSSMSNDISTMQAFLNKEVFVPKLKKLNIYRMERLKEIWPINPIPFLHHLEELKVHDCGSIEVLFNIDLGCVGKTEEVSSSLRIIEVKDLGNLREVWRIKGANDSGLVISGFQAVESLQIEKCKRFRNVFTPTTINFYMRELIILKIDCKEQEINDEISEEEISDEEISEEEISDEEISEEVGRQEQEINEEISEEVGDDISNVVFSSHLIHTTFHHLRRLKITNHKRAEVVFEIENPCSRELATTPQQPLLLPYLKYLKLEEMECMSHVWKCNWNKFLMNIPQNQQSQSSFHNLTTINLFACKNIKYLFSPLMAKLLSNLKEVKIHRCDVIEEVVSSRDDEHEELVASMSTNTSTRLFPHLDILFLRGLPNLKRIGGGSTKISSTTPIHDQSNKVAQVNDVSWSLCQYSRNIWIYNCEALPYVIPSYALEQMQKLEVLEVKGCGSLVEVFETQGSNINGCDEGSGGNDATMVIQRMKKINVPQLSNLKNLAIVWCRLLEHVLTFSTLESLTQLESLEIGYCEAMKVIVKEENEEKTTISSKVVVFPHLKSIQLEDLPNLTGFFLGKKEFEWPSLTDVEIVGCPQMMVFTSGCSIAQKLNYIRTELGKHSLEQYGLNFPVMAATLHESPLSSLDTTSSSPTTSKGRPWSFHNLIEINVKYNDDVEKIIPSNEFRQLQKLEKIHLKDCHLVEEVFEALEGTDGSELQSVVVEIPKLREVGLERLENLKYIWKNNPWMVLEFPNLTKLSITGCNSLKHVFSRSMVGSLLQLQHLRIVRCQNIKVIVKEEECDDKVNEIIMLPRLKSLILEDLPRLKGFYLGKEGFSWSSLDILDIEECPAITVFTMGHLTTPKLKVIDTSFGRCELVTEQDLNSFINTKLKEGL